MSLTKRALVFSVNALTGLVMLLPSTGRAQADGPAAHEALATTAAQASTDPSAAAVPAPPAPPVADAAPPAEPPQPSQVAAVPDAAPPEVDAEPEEPSVNLEFRMGRGLVISSSDRQFQLGIRPRVQFLGTLGVPDEGGDPELGIEIRRARLTFEGHFLGPENRFKLELAISPRDMQVVELEDGTPVPTRTPLLDWYVELRHVRELNFRVGQYKVPYNRERVISSANLAMVDRSIANGEFNLDRDVGFDLRSTDFLGLGWLRYYAGFYGAEGRDGFRLDDLGFMYLGRIEILPFGLFDDYEMVDFERAERPRLSIGVSYAYVDEAPGNRGILGNQPRDGGTTDYHNFEADLLFQYAGLSLLSEFFWREGAREPGEAVDDTGAPIPTELPRNGIGFFVQAGYLLPGVDLEFEARYGRIVRLGDEMESSLSPQDEIGAGISYYFDRHAYKLQADYFHLVPDPDHWERGEERVRLQLQASL